MRRERHTLEDQVGGLIDRGRRRSRAVDEPERYDLHARGEGSPRGRRSAPAPAHRRVA